MKHFYGSPDDRWEAVGGNHRNKKYNTVKPLLDAVKATNHILFIVLFNCKEKKDREKANQIRCSKKKERKKERMKEKKKRVKKSKKVNGKWMEGRNLLFLL